MEYFEINANKVPTDTIKIYTVGTFLRNQARDWYMEWKEVFETANLVDNWTDFQSALTTCFTDKIERKKAHDQMLALTYDGCIQTYCAKLLQLNARVGLYGLASQ